MSVLSVESNEAWGRGDGQLQQYLQKKNDGRACGGVSTTLCTTTACKHYGVEAE